MRNKVQRLVELSGHIGLGFYHDPRALDSDFLIGGTAGLGQQDAIGAHLRLRR